MIAGYISNELIAKDSLSDFRARFMKQNAAKSIDPKNPLSHVRVYIQTPSFPTLQINQNIFQNQHQMYFQQICDIPKSIPETSSNFLSQNLEMKKMYKTLANLEEVISENIEENIEDEPDVHVHPVFQEQKISSVQQPQFIYSQAPSNNSQNYQFYQQKNYNQNEELQKIFMEKTCCDAAEAEFYLSANNYKLEESLALYREYH